MRWLRDRAVLLTLALLSLGRVWSPTADTDADAAAAAVARRLLLAALVGSAFVATAMAIGTGAMMMATRYFWM